jgi:hypothetical protein
MTVFVLGPIFNLDVTPAEAGVQTRLTRRGAEVPCGVGALYSEAISRARKART